MQDTASKILTFMQKAETATSWQIKVALHIPMSSLYLALGALSAEGKVKLEANGINYKVTLVK